MADFCRGTEEGVAFMAAFTRASTSADKKALAERRVAMYKTEQMRLKEAAASRRAAAAKKASTPGSQANTPQWRSPAGRTSR
jgi:hypothetical protein